MSSHKCGVKGHLGSFKVIDLKWSRYVEVLTLYAYIDGFSWDLTQEYKGTVGVHM